MNNHNEGIQRSSSDSDIKEIEIDSDKSQFEDLTKRYLLNPSITFRYYVMLTKGCRDEKCQFKLCASCPSSKKIDIQKASVLSLSLAAKPSIILCPNIKSRTIDEIESEMIDSYHRKNTESSANGISSTFLSRMISFSSLSHLFSPKSRESQNASTKDLKIEEKQIQNFILPQTNARSLNDVNIPLDKEQFKKPLKITCVQDSFQDKDGIRPEYLKDNIWRQLVSDYKTLENPQKIIYILKTVFSSRTRLGKSFLLTNSSKQSPLDFNDLEQFYSSVFTIV